MNDRPPFLAVYEPSGRTGARAVGVWLIAGVPCAVGLGYLLALAQAKAPGWLSSTICTLLAAVFAAPAAVFAAPAAVFAADVAALALLTAVPLAVFAVQLALNLAWSGLFFGLRQLGWAFADIVLLWIAIAATIAAFACVSAPAAWLIAPYLAWVSFASLLNFRIWTLNR